MSAAVVAAFLGRPNAGKSSLFNAVTGRRAHVGNFPGVTVDVEEHDTTLPSGRVATLCDLPGLYRLDGDLGEGTDEAIARDLIDAARAGDKPLVLVQVVDATRLGLGLLLTRQARDRWADTPFVLVLTHADELAREGLGVDLDKLAAATGAKVALTHAAAKDASAVVLAAIDAAEPRPASSFSPEALAAEVVSRVSEAVRSPRARTEAWDRALLHPWLGPPIFVAIMGAMFAAVFLIADPVTDLIDAGTQLVTTALRPRLGGGQAASLLLDGALGGVGTVLAFLPQIIVLIVALELLEASGYLARAAVLVDRLFRGFGLGGKAFVPLLTGHACAVPAITATRVLRDPGERLATILVIPLMSCSARLPVYTLLISAFFGESPLRRAVVATALYVAGVLLGLVAARVMRATVIRGKSLPLLIEMPLYRRPMLRPILHRAWVETKDFTRRAGTVILATSIVLWMLLNTAARPEAFDGEPLIQRSAAAAIGRTLEPVTRPLGFDWRINVGLVGSFGARELMVGTMGVIFGIENADKEPASLVEKIRDAKRPDGSPAYGTPTAVSLLVFFVIACQCMSTLSAIRRETKSTKLAAFVFAYTYALAWVASAIAFQIARAWSS